MGQVGWRERWRVKLREKLSAQVTPTDATQWIPVSARAIKVKPQRLVLEVAKQLVPPAQFRLHAQHHESFAILVGEKPAKVCIVLQANPLTGTLLSSKEAALTAVQIQEFGTKATWFSFASRRKEPRQPTLFPPRVPRTKSMRVEPVKPIPPPASVKEADLAERLRWMLTPPINELISDPELSLPTRPFPFQTLGIKWLYDRDSALLADEMGLGKTMQAIIAARLLWREGLIEQILVVCPNSPLKKAS